MSRNDKLIAKVENHRKGDFAFADLTRYLGLYGWQIVRIDGSHHRFARAGYDSLSIPVHHGKVLAAYVKEARNLVKASEGRDREV